MGICPHCLKDTESSPPGYRELDAPPGAAPEATAESEPGKSRERRWERMLARSPDVVVGAFVALRTLLLRGFFLCIGASAVWSVGWIVTHGEEPPAGGWASGRGVLVQIGIGLGTALAVALVVASLLRVALYLKERGETEKLRRGWKRL